MEIIPSMIKTKFEFKSKAILAVIQREEVAVLTIGVAAWFIHH